MSGVMLHAEEGYKDKEKENDVTAIAQRYWLRWTRK
jgi:hypothetical protein